MSWVLLCPLCAEKQGRAGAGRRLGSRRAHDLVRNEWKSDKTFFAFSGEEGLRE